MKRLILTLTILLSFAIPAYAELENLGTDSLGNRLIYDTDLDITWYDYSNPQTSWWAQMSWATSLSVEFGGTIYTDWRLPDTLPVNGANYDYTLSYDGTTDLGYNITSPNSELAHLYYVGLGNTGFYDTSGNETGCSAEISPYCLTRTGEFLNLEGYFYFSRTEYAPDTTQAWLFGISDGNQGAGYKETGLIFGMAVMDGIAIVPEPISSILFIAGGAVFSIRRFINRKTA